MFLLVTAGVTPVMTHIARVCNVEILALDWMAVLCFPMIVVGGFLYWRGMQYAAKELAEMVIGDSRPDVLYLRAFETDPSISRFMFLAMALSSLISNMVTEEEQLGEVLQPFGDLVAIGRPSETLPTPGVARLYVSDAEWKKVVTSRMQTAPLVVLRAGRSGGILWEFKEAVQLVNPKKLLVLILKMKRKHYETFRKEANQIFNGTLPKAGEIRRFGKVSGFIRFSPNWSPTFLPLCIPFYRYSAYKRYWRLFKFTLRPVFEEHGLEWKPPPISFLNLFLLLLQLLWLLVLFGIRFMPTWARSLF